MSSPFNWFQILVWITLRFWGRKLFWKNEKENSSKSENYLYISISTGTILVTVVKTVSKLTFLIKFKWTVHYIPLCLFHEPLWKLYRRHSTRDKSRKNTCLIPAQSTDYQTTDVWNIIIQCWRQLIFQFKVNFWIFPLNIIKDWWIIKFNSICMFSVTLILNKFANIFPKP